MKPVGIISGTIPLQGEDIFSDLRETNVETRFGSALVFISEAIVFIPRHGMEVQRSIPPHRINHQANLAALRDVGAEEIIGINSTGSLKSNIVPGMIVIPDDYISLSGVPTIFHDKVAHITPSLNEPLRQMLIHTAGRLGIPAYEKGVYWQTSGPRLETRAEIRLMSQFADIIGMTMASEATIADEMGLSYAAICSVDNYAHGLVDKPLAVETIIEGARKNARTILKIINSYTRDERNG